MNARLKLSLLACALGAASITSAQTSNDITPANDVIRVPGSVTTPTMPVVVSPARNDGALIVRSVGDSMDETLSDGAATGASSTQVDSAAPSAGTTPAPGNVMNGLTPNAGGNPAIVDSDGKPAENAGTGDAAGSDTSATSATATTGGANAEAGATSRIVDTKAGNEESTQQAGQRDNTNATPDRFGTPPAKGAPNAPAAASSGK